MHDAVVEFLANGWKLCRIQPGSKGPRDNDWNEPGHEIVDPEAFPTGWGVGLLHAYSGTMALDIDNYPVAKTWLEERGVDLDALMMADDAVQISSGKANSAKLLYACPARPGKGCAPYPATDASGKPRTALALDFRCGTRGGHTQQDALPPTMHPGRGQPYVWVFGMGGHWAALPPLPAELEAIWDEIAAPVTETGPTVALPSGAAPAKIQAWLDTQDPGMTRTDWVVVGMKLHAEFQGSLEGFGIWQLWSSKSSKWDDEARETMLPIWKGFRLEGPALATLETDLRTMPAAAEDFDIIEAESSPEPEVEFQGQAPRADLTQNIETAPEREIRELMQDFLVLQTGGSKSFFLMPGHSRRNINRAAGLAGVEMTHEQVRNVFGPALPPVPAGKNRVVIPDPTEIIRHANWRREVHRVAFNPGGPEYYDDDDGHAYLNAFKAINIEVIKPTASQIAPLDWLLRRVLDDKMQPTGGVFSTWLIRLYAFVLQNPGIKVKWAPLLYSAEQGTGKTTLMETLPALLFGRQYVKPMVHSVLRERFAGAKFDATWWVALSEMHSDAGKMDSKAIANKLKPWITDDTIQIEKKGVDSYDIKNHLQFTACSNHDDALFIDEGSSDRRWLIGEMLGKALTGEEKANLSPLLGDNHVRDPRAQGWLHWYFKHNVNLTGFNPAESPPETAAKTRVREQSRSMWEDAIFEVMETRAPPFDKDIVQPRDITQHLLVGKNVTVAAAKTLLKRVGALEMTRTADYRSLFCIANPEIWMDAKPKDIKAHLISGYRPDPTVDAGEDLL